MDLFWFFLVGLESDWPRITPMRLSNRRRSFHDGVNSVFVIALTSWICELFALRWRSGNETQRANTSANVSSLGNSLAFGEVICARAITLTSFFILTCRASETPLGLAHFLRHDSRTHRRPELMTVFDLVLIYSTTMSTITFAWAFFAFLMSGMSRWTREFLESCDRSRCRATCRNPCKKIIWRGCVCRPLLVGVGAVIENDGKTFPSAPIQACGTFFRSIGVSLHDIHQGAHEKLSDVIESQMPILQALREEGEKCCEIAL